MIHAGDGHTIFFSIWWSEKSTEQTIKQSLPRYLLQPKPAICGETQQSSVFSSRSLIGGAHVVTEILRSVETERSCIGTRDSHHLLGHSKSKKLRKEEKQNLTLNL